MNYQQFELLIFFLTCCSSFIHKSMITHHVANSIVEGCFIRKALGTVANSNLKLQPLAFNTTVNSGNWLSRILSLSETGILACPLCNESCNFITESDHKTLSQEPTLNLTKISAKFKCTNPKLKGTQDYVASCKHNEAIQHTNKKCRVRIVVVVVWSLSPDKCTFHNIIGQNHLSKYTKISVEGSW